MTVEQIIKNIYSAVILQAYEDLTSDSLDIKKEAIEFFKSKYCENIADIIDIKIEFIRKKAKEKVAKFPIKNRNPKEIGKENEKNILEYLKKQPDIWHQATMIGQRVGGLSLHGNMRGSSWASQILKRLIAQGLVIKNEKNLYKILDKK